jgi:hypothetical protein
LKKINQDYKFYKSKNEKEHILSAQTVRKTIICCVHPSGLLHKQTSHYLFVYKIIITVIIYIDGHECVCLRVLERGREYS